MVFKRRVTYLSIAASLFICQIPALSVTQAPVDNFQLPLDARLPQPASSTGEDGNWRLPMEEKLSSEDEPEHYRPIGKKKLPRRLDVSINLSDAEDAVEGRIDQLLDVALARDPQTKVFDKAVAHYRTRTQRVVAEAKDTADYLVPYRGFGPSSEAGDIILDEKVKLKSRASAEYARQRHIDEMHVKVVSNVMQIAMGLGTPDKARSEQTIAQGYSSLKELVGAEETERTLELLNTWMREINVPDSVYSQGAWDVATRQEKYKTVLAKALEDDPILHQITKRLHKYNHRSKFARASSHVVQTVLGTAALTPSFVGPAAKAALVAFVMATGGPEQCKLLKELYLDKRFESRWKVLNEEAHLALENYHVAILTKNPVLLACSESIIDQMTGTDTAEKVLGQIVVARRHEQSDQGAAEVTKAPQLAGAGATQ